MPELSDFVKLESDGDIGLGIENDTVYENNLYRVHVREYEGQDEDGAQATWLSIRRLDGSAMHDWRHIQQIKNMLTDPEREAIEVYPAESRLVDTVNQYHVWVLPFGEKVPYGWIERMVSEEDYDGSPQRKFTDKPDDLLTAQEVRDKLITFNQGWSKKDE